MSREGLVAALVQSAKNLGWTEVLAEDSGFSVQLLVSAPGATEQIVEGAPHRLPKLLKDLGGPENYPALEEYDVLREEFEHVVKHGNIVPEVNQPASAAEEHNTDEEADTEPEAPAEPKVSTPGLHEDPKPGLCPGGSNGASLQASRDFYAQKAAVQVGSQVFVVSGVGLHSGPFSRQFTDKNKALGFAAKCQAKAASPRYAETVRIEYAGGAL